MSVLCFPLSFVLSFHRSQDEQGGFNICAYLALSVSTVMSCYVSQGEEELGLTYVCTWRSSVMSFHLLQSEKGLVCNVRV